VISAVSIIKQTPGLHAAIITGGPCTAGRAFIGGADISEMSTLSSASDAREFIIRLHFACKALCDLPVPVIARVNGHALGGGLLVMLAADLKIAISSALFGVPEVRRGVPSTIESAWLPSIIGAGRARRLLLLGDTISADRAEIGGLVDKVVEEAELDAVVEDWMRALAAAGPRPLAGQKSLLTLWQQVPKQEAVEAGIWEFGRASERQGGESEARTMMKEFLSKGKRRQSHL
jgi:enoyl-CoA hydratase